ncbi:MAG: EAL domain-containing protein [Desulfobulbus sp.]|nr:EAL domain-containing protein [Desulfobulbus sp.]
MTEQATIITDEKRPLIMVVDDDFSARMQLRFTLENAGYEVVEAGCGEEALARFGEQPPELIFLDIIMPDMDGFATCRCLRQIPGGEHTPVVMVTGLEDAETITSAFDAGATDFISKPINMLILGYRVRYWLRSGSILNDLKVSQQRVDKAQQIARLGHWELHLESGKFQISTQDPGQFGVADPNRYESLFDQIVFTERHSVKHFIQEAQHEGRAFSLNYRIVLPNGQERIIFNQGEIVFDRKDRPSMIVGVVQDITELKQAEDQIRYLAFYDNLTGLANRTLFREHWTKIQPQVARSGKKIAIFFIDLDHFKRINDTLGHPVGDKVLITVADRLKSVLRQSDVVSRANADQPTSIISRLGGDEFTLLSANFHALDHIANLAERITQTIEQPIIWNNQMIALSASIGISVYPDDSDDLDILLKNADTAMYEAKEKGRNNFQFFQHQMNDTANARFQLANSLRRALQNNEFELYYQPQFCNLDKKITGVEALIRWQDPEQGLIQPIQFLPFAEESGLIHAINDWVILQACTQASRWVNAGLFAGCRMAVNISGQNINFKKLAIRIMEVLKETGLEPQYLELELTERVMMENTDEAVHSLQKFKEMGIAIAIDDFGTGYSALSHLQIFPLTTLKIDKSFVQNISAQNSSVSLLHSIVGIAKSFNLKVIAEGVETAEQLQVLDEIKCDELQGYLFSRPVTRDQLEQGLQTGVFDLS